jgi:uncharacterized protein (DUF1810 family)|tara:strand:- start:185 stop:610 length:426 start_codon:yes stop_codon:yes gene_type:complete
MEIASNLDRFLDAQAEIYESAFSELKDGWKCTHWMWFVFPQIQGLGRSEMARHYAIQDAAEASAFLEHPVLGARLRECAETVLNTDNRTAAEIFGHPDDLKLKSSMTLFGHISNKPESVFARVLEKFYQGERCSLTLQQLD